MYKRIENCTILMQCMSLLQPLDMFVFMKLSTKWARLGSMKGYMHSNCCAITVIRPCLVMQTCSYNEGVAVYCTLKASSHLCSAMRHVTLQTFFIMHFKWQLAKASESMQCGGKELSAEYKICLPHRIRTRSPRFVCSRMTESIVWQLFFTNEHSDLNNIMACPTLNIEKLINLVQKYQFLYGKNHKYYCNNIIREKVWTEISNSLDNTTGNYMILYSVIYILRNFCNVL